MLIKHSINFFLILLTSITPVCAQEINDSNWKSHPKIKEIRKIYKDINEDIGNNKYENQKLYCSRIDEKRGLSGELYKGQNGIIRKVVIDRGSGPSTIHGEYYYSSDGSPRFSFFQQGAIYGSEQEKRIYFDENGNRLYTKLKPKEHIWKDGVPEMIKDPLSEYVCLSFDNNLKYLPEFKRIKRIEKTINDGIDKGKYKTQSRNCAWDNGPIGMLAIMYEDKNAIIRKFKLEEDTHNSSAQGEYYYSRNGKLRFSYSSQKTVNGTRTESRKYFDNNGELLHSNVRSIEGREQREGPPEYSANFPDSILYPEDHYRNLCPIDNYKSKILIHHQDGIVSYDILEAKYDISENALDIVITAEPSEDHHLSSLGKLTIELEGMPVKGNDCISIAGSYIISRNSYDKTRRKIDWFPTIYLAQGNRCDIDHNAIEITLTEDNGLSISWTGISQDLKYYTGKAKDNKIEIKCNIGDHLINRPVIYNWE